MEEKAPAGNQRVVKIPLKCDNGLGTDPGTWTREIQDLQGSHQLLPAGSPSTFWSLTILIDLPKLNPPLSEAQPFPGWFLLLSLSPLHILNLFNMSQMEFGQVLHFFSLKSL